MLTGILLDLGSGDLGVYHHQNQKMMMWFLKRLKECHWISHVLQVLNVWRHYLS
jgi:hypothetical protein